MAAPAPVAAALRVVALPVERLLAAAVELVVAPVVAVLVAELPARAAADALGAAGPPLGLAVRRTDVRADRTRPPLGRAVLGGAPAPLGAVLLAAQVLRVVALYLPLVVAPLGLDPRVGVVQSVLRPAVDVLVPLDPAALLAAPLVAAPLLLPAVRLLPAVLALAVLSVAGLALAAVAPLLLVLFGAVAALLAVAAAGGGIALPRSVPVWLAGSLSHRC